MIKPDREPINSQARRQLSKGSTRAATVEEAMERVWQFCGSPEGKLRVRAALESGVEQIEYRVKIYKRPESPGFAVTVQYQEARRANKPIVMVDLL